MGGGYSWRGDIYCICCKTDFSIMRGNGPYYKSELNIEKIYGNGFTCPKCVKDSINIIDKLVLEDIKYIIEGFIITPIPKYDLYSIMEKLYCKKLADSGCSRSEYYDFRTKIYKFSDSMKRWNL